MEDNLKQFAIEALKALQEGNDHEMNHAMADDILCQLLIKTGFEEVVEEFNKIYKWYA